MQEPIQLEHVRYMFVIDDDTMQAEMIKDYMNERYLFDVKTFASGEDAMQSILEDQPEIIILDYHLNSQVPTAKNGIEVLKQIKIHSPKTNTVMFSGEDKLEVALASMQNGAYDYVVKGESAFNKIEKVIDTLGERHRLEAINIAQKKTITFLSIAIGLIIAVVAFFFFRNQ
jgi:two-component system, OmpR family, response regulator